MRDGSPPSGRTHARAGPPGPVVKLPLPLPQGCGRCPHSPPAFGRGDPQSTHLQRHEPPPRSNRARAGAPHRGGHAAVLRADDASVTTGPSGLRADHTYLVTGGLGALGLVTARRPAAPGARHLTPASRSGRATDEVSAPLGQNICPPPRHVGQAPGTPALSARPYRRPQDPGHVPLHGLPAPQPARQDPAPRGAGY
ncbi:KR domain-containing protein [Streptomyces roseochromogenus]|uniref:KR domain-containing protein n=1 Tax=Streptomyces roseochromogenus TaxID=285450 RepID=UPI003CC90D78